MQRPALRIRLLALAAVVASTAPACAHTARVRILCCGDEREVCRPGYDPQDDNNFVLVDGVTTGTCDDFRRGVDVPAGRHQFTIRPISGEPASEQVKDVDVPDGGKLTIESLRFYYRRAL